jgi:hypothetical protein
MNFQEKIESLKNNIFKLISTKELTFLKDLDKRILINKKGKFYYKSNNYNYNYEDFLELNPYNIARFFKDLDDKKIYTLIPFITINNRINEPYIILSQQILITNNSNTLLISNYINTKIEQSFDLFNINELPKFNIILKYKQVDIEFQEYKNFSL